MKITFRKSSAPPGKNPFPSFYLLLPPKKSKSASSSIFANIEKFLGRTAERRGKDTVPLIHRSRHFPMIHSCNTMDDILQPATDLKVWNNSPNIRYGQETVQLHFNSPSEIQCTVQQSLYTEKNEEGVIFHPERTVKREISQYCV